MLRRLRVLALRIKAAIYRYTGIYLAHKEELEYVCSEDFWKRHSKLVRSSNYVDSKNIQGLLIGMWQAKRGFYRPISDKRFSKKIHVRMTSYFESCYKAIRMDLSDQLSKQAKKSASKSPSSKKSRFRKK
jgi:hypothetical protein